MRSLFRKPDQVHEPLFAVVPVQNPWRWRSRWIHTERAIKHFMDSGAVVILVELAFNRRDFAFENSGLHGTPADCDIHGTGKYRHQFIGLRSADELWMKEALINAGVYRLTDLHWDWQNVCWLDSDVHFLRPNWVGECIQKLQHYKFLQMFSHARDLSPSYEMMDHNYPHADGRGFVDAFESGALEGIEPEQAGIGDCYPYPYPPRVWPGLAWACTREAWNSVGGLLDVAIWGGGDWHMAHALIEKTEGMMRNDLHRNYKKIVMQWYYRCHTEIRRNVGKMDGSITHHWHGKKSQRGYNTKHALLAKVGFDPLRHLKTDGQGLWKLHDDRSTAYVQMRDLLRKIATERNEDSIDV